MGESSTSGAPLAGRQSRWSGECSGEEIGLGGRALFDDATVGFAAGSTAEELPLREAAPTNAAAFLRTNCGEREVGA